MRTQHLGVSFSAIIVYFRYWRLLCVVKPMAAIIICEQTRFVITVEKRIEEKNRSSNRELARESLKAT